MTTRSLWLPSPRARARPAIAVAMCAAMVLSACGGHPASGRSGDGAASLLPASATQLPTFDPGKFRQLLAQLKGRPVVVNFWGSWCGPCISEAPGLAATARRYRGQVQFVGVDVLDQLTPARRFIRQFNWPYPSVFDPTAAIKNSFGLTGQPVTIVFDASGRQVFISPGATSASRLQQELEKIVGS